MKKEVKLPVEIRMQKFYATRNPAISELINRLDCVVSVAGRKKVCNTKVSKNEQSS